MKQRTRKMKDFRLIIVGHPNFDEAKCSEFIKKTGAEIVKEEACKNQIFEGMMIDIVDTPDLVDVATEHGLELFVEKKF